uniref:Serine/threonine-protein kinase greatwall n=1 Tax=Macrostomum lignano TaxID=282301 RepID=A0A1I8GGA0_9PLAT
MKRRSIEMRDGAHRQRKLPPLVELNNQPAEDCCNDDASTAASAVVLHREASAGPALVYTNRSSARGICFSFSHDLAASDLDQGPSRGIGCVKNSDANNHNLKIDWANMDKKEFMKVVSTLNINDLFAEVVSDSVRYADGAKKWQMPEYVLQRKDRRIFVGGQGFVLFVRRRQHSSSLAMKVCMHSSCKARMERYQLKADLQVIAQRESRFISHLLVYYMTDKFFISVMYKAKHSSLKVIKREVGILPSRFIKYYISCIIDAVFRLHKISICHKDIKADNVLIDHRGVPQLADFGLAVECKSNKDEYVPNRRVTTMQYYPPECLVLGGKVNDYKIDAWLFGFFIAEIYISSNSHMWSKFLNSAKPEWRFHLCDACHPGSQDEALAKLLKSLLRQDPSSRPLVREVIRYSYFEDVNWRLLESESPPDSLHVRTLYPDYKPDG